MTQEHKDNIKTFTAKIRDNVATLSDRDIVQNVNDIDAAIDAEPTDE